MSFCSRCAEDKANTVVLCDNTPVVAEDDYPLAVNMPVLVCPDCMTDEELAQTLYPLTLFVLSTLPRSDRAFSESIIHVTNALMYRTGVGVEDGRQQARNLLTKREYPASSDKKTIEIDVYGGILSQSLMDKIFGQATVGGHGDILLRNVTLTPFPRLIVDYGALFEILCDVAKEYKEYRAENPKAFSVKRTFRNLETDEIKIVEMAEFRVPDGPWVIVKNSWKCSNHTEPITYTMGQESCEVCGRLKP